MRRGVALLWFLGMFGSLFVFIPETSQTPLAHATVPNEQNWTVTPGTCDPVFQGAVFATWNPASGAPNCGIFTSDGPSSNQFDTGQIFPPNVLRDEASVAAPCENGRTSGLCYRMWYVGVHSGDQVRRIGYAVSPDGVSWYRVRGLRTGGSVFEGSGTSGSFDQNGVTTFHVIKDGGQYHMWYTGVDGGWSWRGFGYAISSNGITWTRQNNGQPVLTPRPGLGLFDDDRIIGPFVLIDEASAIAPCENGRTSGRCFRMWYEGLRADNTFYVGHALSPDGISWSIVNGPAALRSVLAGDRDGPLGLDAFDSNNVGLVAVIKDGAIYRMWYQAKGYRNPPQHPDGDWFAIGHVTSVDGVNWVRPNPNLLAFSGDMDDIRVNIPGVINDFVWVVRLLKEDLTYRMWYATTGTPYSTRFGLVEMTQGTPITPTVQRTGDVFSVTFTTQRTIPGGGSVLITLPPNVSLDQFSAIELQGFATGAVLSRERGAITDAYSGFSARDALVLRLPNGANAGSKVIRFSLGAGAPNPAYLLVQTFDTHKVLERARVNLADLRVTQSVGSIVAGETVTYTVTISNVGPNAVSNALLSSAFPTQLTSVAWTCAASGGASCAPPSGSGNWNNKPLTLPPGSSVTFTVTGNLSPAATGSLTSYVNVVTPVELNELTPGDNTSTLEAPINVQADLSITRSSVPATPQAGWPITYTLIVSNSGPGAAFGATVVNQFPISVTNVIWNCSATPGSFCPASGSGNINTLVNLAPGGVATFTATGVVSPFAVSMPPHSAIVTAPWNVIDPNPENNLFTDGGGLGRSADLTISKSASPTIVVPGLPITYTITVTNNGPLDADGATVLDPLPPTITNVTWTCSSTNGASCAQANGDGNLELVLPAFPVGGSATITITGIVAADATGNLINTAQVLPPVGVEDPTPANNSATIASALQPRTDLAITQSMPSYAIVGQTIAYAVTVRNNGPSLAAGARVSTILPAFVSVTGWTCTASAGSQCGASSGNAPVDDAVTLTPGGTVTYTITGTVFSQAVGQLLFSSTVTAQSGAEDPVLTNNQAQSETQVMYVVTLPLVVR